MLTIRFNKSQSKNYPKAVKASLELGAICENGEVTLAIPDYELLYAYEKLYPLLGIIGVWKGMSADYNGKKLNPYQFVLRIWQTVRKCAEEKNNSLDPRHCWIDQDHEGWGCKLLGPFSRHITGLGNYSKSNQFWYNYGQFNEHRNWKVNKDLILQKLVKNSEERCINLCPFFEPGLVAEIVDEFPEVIIIDGVNFKPFLVEGKVVNIRHCPGILKISNNVIASPSASFGEIYFLNQVRNIESEDDSLQIHQN